MEVLQEKKLSKAEKNKKEDIVKAMAKQGASKDSKTYAIATAKAKKLAEGETSMDDILLAFQAALDIEDDAKADQALKAVYNALKSKVKSKAGDLYQKARVGFAKSQGIDPSELNEAEEETDAIDTITMDVPLFIRMLEYAKEDASADVDLHDVAENAVALNKEQDVLSMDDYDSLLPSGAEPMDESRLKEVEEAPINLPIAVQTKANSKVVDAKSLAKILKDIYTQIQSKESIDFSKNQNIKYVIAYLDKAINEKPKTTQPGK